MKINNLAKTYYSKDQVVEAVKDFSIDIHEGDFIAIVGPSGCGKSTILSILSNLENKTSGNINTKENINIGYMLQEDSLFEWRNILDNCLLGLEINHSINENSKNRVINLLKTYGLNDFIYSHPNDLSGGMRQRVALIRTLASNPDLLLLDEPFSALDYQSRLAISDDIYNILKKENKTMIMVTHDIAEAISMCDKVIVLSNRPSIIKNIYNIELEKKSNPINNRKDKKFSYYYDAIWKDIDFHV